jgi:urea transport system permease protein
VALGVDLIWGYTGLLSLGHGVFFALGGYALAMYLQLQLPPGQIPDFFSLYGVNQLPAFWQPFYSFPFTLLAIALVPALVGAAFGYLVFRNRIRGVYFSILTQASLIVFYNFFNGQQKLINGTNGLKTDTATLFGTVVSDPKAANPVLLPQRRVFGGRVCPLSLADQRPPGSNAGGNSRRRNPCALFRLQPNRL